MSLWIGAALCSLRLSFAGSLKERRQVVRSILDGVRSRFSISPADLGPDNTWNAAELGFSASASSPAELEERLDNLEKFLGQKEETGEFEIIFFTREVFAYGDISYKQNK